LRTSGLIRPVLNLRLHQLAAWILNGAGRRVRPKLCAGSGRTHFHYSYDNFTFFSNDFLPHADDEQMSMLAGMASGNSRKTRYALPALT